MSEKKDKSVTPKTFYTWHVVQNIKIELDRITPVSKMCRP